jgi:hypothetical protein
MSDFSYWRDLAGEYLRLAEVCKDTPMALAWTELAGAYSRAISELGDPGGRKDPGTSAKGKPVTWVKAVKRERQPQRPQAPNPT